MTIDRISEKYHLRHGSMKWHIIRILQERGSEFGGVLEREIGELTAKKCSNVSRRCRELEEDGLIVGEEVRVPTASNEVVKYRLPETVLDSLRPKGYEVIRDAETGKELYRRAVYA